MEKNFDFKRAESEINNRWLSGNLFRANANSGKQPFTTIMPPPNVTSRLHIGHAFGLTIQDAITRFKRMQGFEALFLPGADHAAIATEIKVIEELRRQGIEKKDLTRDEFLSHVNKWYEVYIREITDQMKRLGISADWSRFAFTMDEPRKKAVAEAFKRLHDKGLIYKGERIINWCSKCETAMSDIEVEHKPKEQTLYTILFKGEDKASDIAISTVRPEVVFNNVAIAVNPKDKRFTKIIGKSVSIPLTFEKVPIILDASVDMKFGTGALQITPANSAIDYEIAKKHNLGMRNNDLEEREVVVAKLKDAGLIVATKKHTSNVGVCYRCKTIVEPKLSQQWFVRMESLAKSAIEALNNGLAIQPKKFEKIYLHWLKNIRDWCISRQLTSGHPIPIEGETDVLDTWFSSALWPFSALSSGADYEFFYPTQVMVMGYDILFFWMIRMVFSGLEHTGKLPFNRVLFHGLVRDKTGAKMSKSAGNGIDPLEIINEYGADVLRFSLLYGTKLDRDPRYSVDKAVLARNFINKIWNATKFYLLLSKDSIDEATPKTLADKWIITKLSTLIKSITKKYEKFDFGVACVELQNFFWHDFCDVYLEEVKSQKSGYGVFRHVLTDYLKLLSPIMPFVTEEIYVNILKTGESLALSEFPTAGKTYPREKRQFDEILEAKREERALKEQKADEAVALAKRGAKIEMLKREIARSEGMIGNENFVARAPKKLVDEERAKLEQFKLELGELLN